MSKLSQGEIDALFAQFGPGNNGTTSVPNVPPSPALVPESEPGTDPVPGKAAFPILEQAPSADTRPASIGLLAGVELEVTVRLGRTTRSIRELLSLGAGSVLELDNLAGETVDILVNGRLLARGEVVVVGENYGVRIVELVRLEGGALV